MRRRAFTLIEVLLAASLTALLGLAVAQVLFVSQQAQERVRARGARRALRGALERRLRADLRAAVPPGGLYAAGLTGESADRAGSGEALLPAELATAAEAPEGTADPPPAGARDRIVVAVLPAPPPYGETRPAGEGAIREVTWEIDDDPETEERGLIRTALRVRDPLPGADAPLPDVLAADAVGLDVRYYDGQAWVETWDSASSEALPRLIELRLALAPGGEELETLRIEVSPPAAQVGDVREAAQ